MRCLGAGRSAAGVDLDSRATRHVCRALFGHDEGRPSSVGKTKTSTHPPQGHSTVRGGRGRAYPSRGRCPARGAAANTIGSTGPATMTMTVPVRARAAEASRRRTDRRENRVGADGGGNKGHVHGLDRKLAAAQAANADARSSAKRPAFALRDAPASDARRAARRNERRRRKRTRDARGEFGDALPRTRSRTCTGSAGVPWRAPSRRSRCSPRTVKKERCRHRPCRRRPPPPPLRRRRPPPRRRRRARGPTSRDALPAELRLLVLDLVGPKDAARAARTCRDFAETVRAWRANKKHLAPPAALTVTGVCSLIRAYPNLESVSLRRCARGRLRYSASDVFRVPRAAASGPAARTLRPSTWRGATWPTPTSSRSWRRSRPLGTGGAPRRTPSPSSSSGSALA